MEKVTFSFHAVEALSNSSGCNVGLVSGLCKVLAACEPGLGQPALLGLSQFRCLTGQCGLSLPKAPHHPWLFRALWFTSLAYLLLFSPELSEGEVRASMKFESKNFPAACNKKISNLLL